MQRTALVSLALAALLALAAPALAAERRELHREAAAELIQAFEERAQAWEGAANGIKVQGRQLFEDDFRRIASFERGALELRAAASTLKAAVARAERDPVVVEGQDAEAIVRGERLLAAGEPPAAPGGPPSIELPITPDRRAEVLERLRHAREEAMAEARRARAQAEAEAREARERELEARGRAEERAARARDAGAADGAPDPLVRRARLLGVEARLVRLQAQRKAIESQRAELELKIHKTERVMQQKRERARPDASRADELELQAALLKLESDRLFVRANLLELEQQLLRNEIEVREVERTLRRASEGATDARPGGEGPILKDGMRIGVPRVADAGASWVLATRYDGPASGIHAAVAALFQLGAEKGLECGGPVVVTHDVEGSTEERMQIELAVTIADESPKPWATKSHELKRVEPGRVALVRVRGPYEEAFIAMERLQGFMSREKLEARGPLRVLYFDDPESTPAERLKTEFQLPVGE